MTQQKKEEDLSTLAQPGDLKLQNAATTSELQQPPQPFMTPRHGFQRPKLTLNLDHLESRERDDGSETSGARRRGEEQNSKDRATVFSGKSQNNDNFFNKSQRSNNRGILYQGKMNSHMAKMNVLSKHNIAQKFNQNQASQEGQSHFESEVASKEMALTPKRRMSSMSPLLKQDSSIGAKHPTLTRRESTNAGRRPRAFEYDEKTQTPQNSNNLHSQKYGIDYLA